MPAPSDADTPFATVRADLAGLGRMLGTARFPGAADRSVALAGLDAAMGAVCVRAPDQPREAGRALRPMLVRPMLVRPMLVRPMLVRLVLRLDVLAMSPAATAPPLSG